MVTSEATGTSARWDARDRADFAAHNADLPLLSIQGEEELHRALAKLAALVDLDERSAGSEGYLGALTDLVSVYESRVVHFPRVSGLAVLRHLMEERDLQQKDLVGVFGTKSVASEVLTGHRRPTLAHLTKLGAYFGLPVDVFIDPPHGNPPGVTVE